MIAPGLISLLGTEATQGQYVGSCQSLVPKVTDVSKLRVGWRGTLKPIFPLPLSLQSVLYSQFLPACFLPPPSSPHWIV